MLQESDDILRLTAIGHEGKTALTVRFGVAPSPIGPILVGRTDTGVCAVLLGGDADVLAGEFPRAALVADDAAATAAATRLAGYVAGTDALPDLQLDLRGTPFQRAVWAALLRVPAGTTASYADIARDIGAPAAYRAVANACGANHVAILVPCHRIVRTGGGMGGYRGGIQRKEWLLALEKGV
ncbi:MAG: methylated-DNA--[protein]-cysteine S-methyltransferase [Coriobacteriia bacterium]|nr:methylated-DNA--[protein]-cysteine S-methyltransferase [Coriobacteriia bacterium]